MPARTGFRPRRSEIRPRAVAPAMLVPPSRPRAPDQARARPAAGVGSEAVGMLADRLRIVPQHPEREGQDEDEGEEAQQEVGRPPADRENEPHGDRDEERHPRHGGARQHADDGAPPPDKPAHQDRRGDHVARGREAHGRDDPVKEVELPERRGPPPGGGGGRAREGGPTPPPQPGAEAVHEPADDGHEGAIEEEREGDDEGETPAVQAEIRDKRLEEGTHRKAKTGGEKDDHAEGYGDPPAVKELPPRHGAPLYRVTGGAANGLAIDTRAWYSTLHGTPETDRPALRSAGGRAPRNGPLLPAAGTVDEGGTDARGADGGRRGGVGGQGVCGRRLRARTGAPGI